MANRLTPAEYKALIAPKKGRYGQNKRVKTEDGIFDSKGEFKRWCHLRLLQKQGAITELERQVPFSFEHNGLHLCIYNADFTYRHNGALKVEDFKGNIITDEFRLKAKMMLAWYGLNVHIVKKATAEIAP